MRLAITAALLATLALAGEARAGCGAPAPDAPPGRLDPAMESYRHLFLPLAGEGGFHARFMGVSTVLFRVGDDAILVDGYFSRPGLWRVLGKIAPDRARIDYALGRARITGLHAVLAAQSHVDHAFDAAAVVEGCPGARLVGSESTANIGRGAGLTLDRIHVFRDRERLLFGDGRIAVTVFRSPHGEPFLARGDITAPLRPPAYAWDYREGGSFSFLVEQGGRRILVHPGANFEPGMYEGVRADAVLLGIAGLGGRGRRKADFAGRYWDEVVKKTHARLVVPIHWDDFFSPLDRPLRPSRLGFTRAICRVLKQGKADRIPVRFMPTFEPVDLVAAADAPDRDTVVPDRCLRVT